MRHYEKQNMSRKIPISRQELLQELKQLTYYNRETGEVFWNNRAVLDGLRQAAFNKKVGCSIPIGICIQYKGAKILMHHYIYFLEFGELPPRRLSHIDGNLENNRIDNLCFNKEDEFEVKERRRKRQREAARLKRKKLLRGEPEACA